MSEKPVTTPRKTVEKVERKCQMCGATMLVYQSQITNGVAGKFCSHSCAAKNRTLRNRTVQRDESYDFLNGDEA